MTLSVNTNLLALAAQRHQGTAEADLSRSLARLSSGLRINGAKDDAAGLAIADRLTAQMRGMSQAGRNANDGISLAQTAEGALASIDTNLQRIRELSVQAGNATNSSSDRASLQLEVVQLQSEIDRVATQTEFNGVKLLDGSFTNQVVQVGADSGQTIGLSSIVNARVTKIGFASQGFNRSRLIGLNANATPAALTVSIGGAPAISLGSVAHDAKAIAASINAASITGLTAAASPVSVNANQATTATGSGIATLTLNGVDINLSGTAAAPGAAASNRTAAVNAINLQSALTGVVATDAGTGLNLTADDGRNIAISYSAGSFTGSTGFDFGLPVSAPLWGSAVTVSYAAPPGVSGNVSFVHSMASGFTFSAAIAPVGTSVGALDVSSVAGANTALVSTDAALASISAARASLGAVQSRFVAAARNLQTAGQNVAASRSRILDADFAAETASLARSEILQRAGTAMVSQANQTPAQVLSLLR